MPKNKLAMKLFKFEQNKQKARSRELFNKDYNELTTVEQEILNEYNHDLLYPTYKPVKINGLPTMYIVSNTGIIKNKFTGREIKQGLHYKGYPTISLQYGNGQTLGTFVHRVVAQAFIPNPENKPQVNHINGNKLCNWYKNLEWCTASENIQHAIKEGLFYTGQGEYANAAKYSEKQIHQVCSLLALGKFTNTEIANFTKVDVANISKIKNKEIWRHISSQYDIKRREQNAKGSDSASSKYKDEQIHEVCRKLKEGLPMTTIARETGVGYDMIFRIKRGKNWLHISSQYGIKPETK